MVNETTDIAALRCPFYLPQPGQSEDVHFCAVLKPNNEAVCLTYIWLLWKMFQWAVQTEPPQESLHGELCVCAGGLDIL